MGLFTTPLAGAIANAEGFGQPGAIPTVTNNPGDLKVGDVGFGTTDSGITYFGNLADGVAALESQVSRMLNGGSKIYTPDMSIAQAGSLYSGGDANWAANVAKTLGVPQSTSLADANSGASSGVMSRVLGSTFGQLGIPNALDATSSTQSWVTRGAFIAVGLILIAGGIFGFKTVQGTVIEFGKGVANGAKTAAIAA